ncbi:phospholipid-transporting ATPase ABCA3-like isoform X2 [Dermacentor albipictus]|uniref:phospholipid-transporting ATPase ABCA3-like isoform X2 n=1 Tax=Dermacentor albipictus TaxID=60249 RepID=UPI0031FE3467
MCSFYNVWLLIWRRLLVQTVRRHYLALAFELAFVLAVFLFILHSDHVDLKEVIKHNRSFVRFHSSESIYVSGNFHNEPTNLTVVYGPGNNHRDKLIAAVIKEKEPDEPLPPEWPKVSHTVVRVDDAASVVAKCREAITRRGRFKYAYTDALKRTLCVEFLTPDAAGDTAKSLSYNFVVPLPSDATFPTEIMLDMHEVLTNPHFHYSSAEIDAIKAVTYHWQALIDRAHMSLHATVPSTPKLYVGVLPGDLPVSNIKGYRNGFFAALSVGFCLPLVWRIRDVNTEIASGLKDMQGITGLSSNQFWLGHFLSALPLTLAEAVIATCVVFLRQEPYRPTDPNSPYNKDDSELPDRARKYIRVHRKTPESTSYLENADASLVFTSFGLFTVCHTLLALLVACVFPFGRWAMVIGFAVYYMFPTCDGDKLSILFRHSLYVYLSESKLEKFRTALYPNVAFSTIMKIIGIFDDFERSAGWDIISTSALNMDRVTILEMLSIMGASCCVFVVMIVYLSKVLPWATSTPVHPLFFLAPSYWFPREVTFTEMLPGAPNSERFQPRPAFAILINCKDVVKTFGNTVALNKVNMTIHKAQVTILLGHNGAGKTTLMSIFTGLIRPDSGAVTLGGRTMSASEVRKNMAFCPQFDAFFDDLTVSDHLTYFGLLKGMRSSTINTNITTLLRTMQLSDKADALPRQLSGGMKRKLSIAIALITKPQILILDEPTVGLDPDTRRVIWKVLQELRINTTVLLSTHDMEEADALGDRIIIMYSGTVVCWGTPSFLKDACGVGYKLRISKVPNAFNSKAVLSAILNAAPMAALDDDKDNEAVFALNTMDRNGFADMFNELEAKGPALGIKSIGVTVATMKEAYIKIYKEWVGDAKKDQPPQKDVADPVVVVARQPNCCQRFRALVQKRLLILWRSPFLFITGWVLPILIAFVGLSVAKHSSQDIPPAYQYIDFDVAAYVDADREPPLRTFLQTSQTTDTSLGYKVLLESGKVPFDNFRNAKETLMTMLDENFLEYARTYAFGTVFNGTKIELWSSRLGVVAQNVLRNMIDTVLLRQHTGQASSHFRTGISLYRLTDEELYDEAYHRDPSFGLSELTIYTWAYWTFMGSVSFGLIMSSFVVLPSLEVVSEARELQLMTGVSGFLYLFAHFVFDLAFYAVPMAAIFLGYSAILDLPSDTQGPGVIIGYFQLAYASGAEIRLPCMFFPPFALPAATVRAINIKYEVAMCDYLRSKTTPKKKHVDFCKKAHNYDATIKLCCDILSGRTNEVWSEPAALSFSSCGVLWDVVVMLAMGAALFAYLLYRASGRSRLGREASTPPPRSTTPEDADVAAERAAVADICTQRRFGGDNALVAQELHKAFGDAYAVRGLSFALKPAQCFGLLGVNGAGKTTTFRMLVALLRLTYGDAYIKDAVLSRDTRKWQSMLGYCPQAGALLEKLTAYETLHLFGRLRGVPEDKLAAVVENVINIVDLREQATRVCSYYSGGNKRKLSTAVAMIGFPEVVFLDEPYAGVDVLARSHIHRGFERIKSTTKNTMVLTSHSMDECELACDRLCIMVGGQMACLGTLQHIKDRFGKGYKLLFLRPENASVGPQDLVKAIADAFPGVTIVEEQWKSVECRTQDRLPWSQLFKKIAALEKHFAFEHVLVSDNTLEQIFIAFVREAQKNQTRRDAVPAVNAKASASASASASATGTQQAAAS